MLNGKVRLALLELIIVIAFTTLGSFGIRNAMASTYFVDVTRGNDSNEGSIDRPWKTLYKANTFVQPGDTVYIREGVYHVTNDYKFAIYPNKSGEPAKPITFSNYASEHVEFVGLCETASGVFLDSRSHIHVRGFTFRNFFRHLWILNGSYNEISMCVFVGLVYRQDQATAWRGSTIYRNSKYNRISGCAFMLYGNFANNDDNGVVFELGNEYDSNDATSYNVVEDSIFYGGAHHVFGIGGSFNVVRRNYFHNEPWWPSVDGKLYGNRVLMSTGSSKNTFRNLIEKNVIAFGSDTIEPDQVGGAGLVLASSHNILRNNAFYNNGLYGLSFRVYPEMRSSYNMVYHNVFFQNGILVTDKKNMDDDYTHAVVFFVSGEDYSEIYKNSLKNNLFYKNRNLRDVKSPIIRTGQFTLRLPLREQEIEGNWLEEGDPQFVNIPISVEPETVVKFDIKPESAAVDRGVFLTVVTGSAGSGSSFVVADAGYFMDGWGIVQGDEIQLEGTAEVLRIVKVDYGENRITVDRDISWYQGQGIALRYGGRAPDIGMSEVFDNGQELYPPQRLRIKVPPGK